MKGAAKMKLGWIASWLVVAVLQSAPTATAQVSTFRANWVPGAESFAFGDVWTFNCPANGTVSVSVDTWDDRGDSSSNIDPVLEVRDKNGNLLVDASGSPTGGLSDDAHPCTIPPVCGILNPTFRFWCPEIVDIPCGKGNPHTVMVYGNPNATSFGCSGGGAYALLVSAKDKKGKSVAESKLALGGGPTRKLPTWADAQDGIDKAGPALDDVLIPAFYAGNPAVAGASEIRETPSQLLEKRPE
jgi:hypothetical protein